MNSNLCSDSKVVDDRAEKRKFPRLKVECPVELSSEQSKSKSITGTTLDISEGGVCVSVDSPIENNFTSALSKIKLTTADIEPYVELIWNDRQRCGFKIVDISSKDKTSLQKFLYLSRDYVNERLIHIIKKVDMYSDAIKVKIFDLIYKEVLPFIENATLLEKRNDAEAYPQSEIKKIMDRVVTKADELDRYIGDKTIIEELKNLFRGMTGTWLYQSKIVEHAAKKPYGYPGDYELIESVYDNIELSQGSYRLYDRYLLNSAYAEAVRNRKDLMKNILLDYISESKTGGEKKILNLACGSSREIREMFQERPDLKKKSIFYCVDFDDKALEYSKNKLKEISPEENVHFIKEDIINFALKPEKHFGKYNNMDMVYSIGLADYLRDRILKRLLQFCYSLIKPGGQLIVAFKDREKDRHAPLSPDWYCDWTFMPRTKNRVLDIYEECKLGDYSQKIIWEQSGIIFYIILTKRS